MGIVPWRKPVRRNALTKSGLTALDIAVSGKATPAERSQHDIICFVLGSC